MAKYDNTKFYWLQLKEDFFDEDAIDWLEDQPNGKEYSLFYLKLCLKSLRTHGILIRNVGNMVVPYDHVKLGELTKTNADTVKVAMQLLIEIGLVEILGNGALYIQQVETMIGSQSKSAFKKQQYRIAKKNNILLGGGQEEDNCPPNIEIEKEKEEENKKDKIDKSNISIAPPNSFTKKLLEIEYIEEDDLNIEEYNNLFYELVNEFSFDIVRTCLYYFVSRYKNTKTDEFGKPIFNKLAYLKTTMINNVEMIDHRNNTDFDDLLGSWLKGFNN